MGWMTTYKPKGEPALDFFARTGVFTWSDDNPNKYRVLDSAVVKFNTFYAAIEQTHKETGERRVWAAVILIQHYPKDIHNFGWKEMSEADGPFASECPKRILKLLTPTDSDGANDWRKRCWANIEDRKIRKNLPHGTVLKYENREYTIDRQGRGPVKNRTWVTDESGQPWLMRRSQLMDAEIVSRPDKNG
jgi:hypothetical protein